MRKLVTGLMLAWLGAAASGAAHAGAVERLKNFVQQTRSVKAEFVQTILDKDANPTSESRGTMRMWRPGRFRWEYLTPYSQLIIGDGEKLWLWDPDLNQATMKKLDAALGSSPAALLAGNDAIEQSFTLKEAGRRRGLEWLEATPKASDAGFERIRMGFNAKTLDTLEFKDSFGQTTIIRFSRVEANLQFPQELFQFTLPQGAELISDQ